MLSRSFKKVTYPLRFRNLNSPFMRKGTHVDAYEPSEDDYRLFIAKLDDVCFCLLPAAILVPPSVGHKDGVSIQSLHETFHRPESLRDCLNIHLFLSL